MVRPVIVSVEAVIAAGKSTLLGLIEKKLGKHVYVVQEPVREWQKIEGDEQHNILGCFYDDMDRWSFSFQTYVLFTVARAIQNAVDELEAAGRLEDTVILVERSYETSKETFTRMLYDSGRLTEQEWSMYLAWWEWIAEKAPQFSGSIYMRTSVDTVMERLRVRNRGEESSITREYQSELIQRHEDWMSNQSSLLVVDAEVDFVNNVEELDAICNSVISFFQSLRDAENSKTQEADVSQKCQQHDITSTPPKEVLPGTPDTYACTPPINTFTSPEVAVSP